MKNIFAICGSTKKDSANHKLIKHLQWLSKGLLNIEVFEGLTQLPYFDPNPENENHFPSVNAFRQHIQEADGVLICTPEYVFSLPGILKNAIEWTVSTTVFTNKPAALITASSSGKIAHESLLLVMKTLGVKTTPQTTLLISGIKSKMNQEGIVHHPETAEQLKMLVHQLSSELSSELS
jgi:chromate reductase, NAD(P)H dehydrogenase (quinone)